MSSMRKIIHDHIKMTNQPQLKHTNHGSYYYAIINYAMKDVNVLNYHGFKPTEMVHIFIFGHSIFKLNLDDTCLQLFFLGPGRIF